MLKALKNGTAPLVKHIKQVALTVTNEKVSKPALSLWCFGSVSIHVFIPSDMS